MRNKTKESERNGMGVAAVVFGVKSYMKKLSSGCCGTSVEKEKRIGARDSDETHYPYAYEITVEGMHCGNCATRLENAFHGQKEGMLARADVPHARVTLRAKEPVEEGRIRQIIALAGYRAVWVETAKKRRKSY